MDAFLKTDAGSALSGAISSGDAGDDAAITPQSTFKRVWGFLSKQQAGLRPTREFLGRPSLPKTYKEGMSRLWHNGNHFQANYVAVTAFLAVYCVLANPLLLIAFAVLAVGMMLARRAGEQGISAFGRKFHSREIMFGTALLGVPLLLIAGLGSTFFWLLGASACFVAVHAMVLPEAPTTPPEEELV